MRAKRRPHANWRGQGWCSSNHGLFQSKLRPWNEFRFFHALVASEGAVPPSRATAWQAWWTYSQPFKYTSGRHAICIFAINIVMFMSGIRSFAALFLRLRMDLPIQVSTALPLFCFNWHGFRRHLLLPLHKLWPGITLFSPVVLLPPTKFAVIPASEFTPFFSSSLNLNSDSYPDKHDIRNKIVV